MSDERLLLPISQSITIRQTIGYAIESAIERNQRPDRPRHKADRDRFPDRDDDRRLSLSIHLVAIAPFDDETPESDRRLAEYQQLLDRATAWVHEDADERNVDVTTETAVLGTDEYLFSPQEFAEAINEYAEASDVDRIVLDPEFQPGATSPMLQPLEREFDRFGLQYEEAPVERPARHERLAGTESRARFVSMFAVSYVFYLVLGDPTYWFDLVTGAAVGLIVAITLSHVTFTTAPTLRESPVRHLRFTFYVPYLIFEIIKANLAISVVILRPSLPIDPRLTRVEARVRSGLPLLTLANSITLTPGTLTVRANDQRLIVHTLFGSAREDLFDGRLERAVRFIFYGRRGARIPSPRERGDADLVDFEGDEL